MSLKEDLYEQAYNSILKSVPPETLNKLQEAVVMRHMANLGHILAGTEATVKSIVMEVEKEFDVTFTEMTNGSRQRFFVVPRQITMWLISKTRKNITLEAIGALFDKHHATVIHAFKQVENDIQTDLEYRERLAMILNRLGFETTWKQSDIGRGGEFTFTRKTNYDKTEAPVEQECEA